MADSVTKITETGWLSQITSSIKTVLVGIVLFAVAFPALFVNEGCYVKTKKALDEGLGLVITVKPDSVDPGNESKLVHMIGEAVTEETLTDDEFGVSVNAIKLSRTAEMYQWEEEEHTKTTKKTGGKTVKETTYTYEKTWSEGAISSSGFQKTEGHENPGAMPYESNEWKASLVTVGAFKLSPSLIDSINKFESVAVNDELLAKLSEDLRAKAKISGEFLYIGTDPATPAIGDVRISFKSVNPTTVSLYSKQVGNTFEGYTTSNKQKLQRLEIGTHSAEEMFAAAQSENVMRLWIIRIGGFLAMAIGISMIFAPLVAIANVLPFLGDLIQGGAYVFGGIVAFALSFITISMAWLFYRPLIGIPLLLIGVGSIVGFIILKKRGKGGAAPAAE